MNSRHFYYVAALSQTSQDLSICFFRDCDWLEDVSIGNLVLNKTPNPSFFLPVVCCLLLVYLVVVVDNGEEPISLTAFCCPFVPLLFVNHFNQL